MSLCDPFWLWLAAMVDHVADEEASLIGSITGCRRAIDTCSDKGN